MRLLIDCFLLSFDFVVEVSSTSFCSNPDALGFDESENGIFDSLKNIARLPLDLPKVGDRGICLSGRRARSLLPLAPVSGLI